MDNKGNPSPLSGSPNSVDLLHINSSSGCEKHEKMCDPSVLSDVSDDSKLKSAAEGEVISSVVGFHDATSTSCIIINNMVSTGTSTEGSDQTLVDCKYCKTRVSKLRGLERTKAFNYKRKTCRRFKPSPVSKSNQSQNKSCQTSSYLYEQAEMTKNELRGISVALQCKSQQSYYKSETFCKCVMYGRERDCRCGEDEKYFEWTWDPQSCTPTISLFEEGCLAIFHKDFSCGTATVRGQIPMTKDQHFWEIKMTTPVYGTDMMVGVGTKSFDLSRHRQNFCSMLGHDVESWGISYDGRVQHAGKKKEYCCRFSQGAIIGVHLDMWQGTLSFFKNRQSLGTAFTGLRGQTLHPMACSTAARSGMKVISAYSFQSSLQFACCQRLRQVVPAHLSVLDALSMPPGLRAFLANNVSWLLRAFPSRAKSVEESGSVCSICLPLKSVLEGFTDDEESDDEYLSDSACMVCSLFENDSDGDKKEDTKRRTTSRGSKMTSKDSQSEQGSSSSQHYVRIGSKRLRVELQSSSKHSHCVSTDENSDTAEEFDGEEPDGEVDNDSSAQNCTGAEERTFE